MRRGVLFGLRRLPLITDSYCSPRQPLPPPLSQQGHPLSLCFCAYCRCPPCLPPRRESRLSMGTTQWQCLIPFRVVGASSSYPLLCIVRSFILPSVRVLLFATSKCKDDSFRPRFPLYVLLLLEATLGWRPPIIAPFPLRHPPSSLLPPCSFFTKPHHFPAAKVVCLPISWVRGNMRMANVLMKIFLFLFTANKKCICMKSPWRTLSRHDSSCTCKIDV